MSEHEVMPQEEWFHFSPIVRDILDGLWERMIKEIRDGQKYERVPRYVIEQYIAKVVRQQARQGCWNGNEPK